MLASTGTLILDVNSRYSSSVRRASAKIMSAPASRYASARSMAAVWPSTAWASVRAMMTKAGSCRASTAALMRSDISSAGTRALPGRWPQRLVCTWSSRCIPAAPDLMRSCVVRAMLNAAPQPVSASTSSGRSVAAVMRRTSSQTSFSEVIPRSGSPNEAFATPAPDRYRARKPACSASRALKALTVPTTCNGVSAASAALRRCPLLGVTRCSPCGLEP